MTSGLLIRNVTFAYHGRVAVRDVSWAVAPGEIAAVVGPNGAGKSTLIGLVSGWLKPSAGSIAWNGRRPGSPTVRAWARDVAVVWQDVPADVPFTVRQAVSMGRLPHGDAAAAEGMGAAEEAMARADVQVLADRLVASLSGGERQRVYVARALAQTPSCLLLDEPTAHLDLAHQVQAARIVRELAGAGVAVLWASHDLNAVAETADRVLVLKAGLVEAEGSPQDVMTEEILSRVYDCPVRVFPDPETGRPRVFARVGEWVNR